MCFAWQWVHLSGVRVVSADTSFRLVVPQRVQFHSAVRATTVTDHLPPRAASCCNARRMSCEVSSGAPDASAARTASSAGPGP
jgi:hypothetical protein